MPRSEAASATSSTQSDSATLPRGVGLISNKHVEVDGHLFMKVRQCPASGAKNTDPNVITEGKYGPEYSRFVVWHRGTSASPDSRYERVSVLTWQIGGFADTTPNMDDFVAKMRDDNKLTAEFKAAYTEMVKVIESGVMKFGPHEKQRASMRLQKARNMTVQVYEKQQIELKRKYTAVEKSIYEKEHPGRIEKAGLQVTQYSVKGVMKDFVLVPQMPEGHYELDDTFVHGTSIQEVVDDGSMTIAQGQQQTKFRALADQQANLLTAAAANHKIEKDAEMDEADLFRAQSDQEVESAPESVESDDSLCFARSVFNMGSPRKDQPAAIRSLKAASSVKPKSKASGVKQPPPVGSSRPLRPPPNVTRKPAPSPPQASEGGPEMNKKFEDKSPEQILEKHGLPAIKTELKDAIVQLSTPTIDKLRPHIPDYDKEFGKFIKSASSVHKQVVALHIKVKKWLGVPEALTKYIEDLRVQTTALSDCIRMFPADLRKQGAPDNMNEALCNLERAGFQKPKAFLAMALRQSMLDQARFGNTDDILTLCDLRNGFLKGVDDADLELCVIDAVSDVFQCLAKSLSQPFDTEKDEATLRNMAALAGRLALSGSMPSATEDLQMLANAFGSILVNQSLMIRMS